MNGDEDLPYRALVAAAAGDSEGVVANCRRATPTEWAKLLSLSFEHRVQGVLMQALYPSRSRLPGWAAPAVRQIVNEMRIDDSVRSSGYRAVLGRLEEAGARVVTMKGLANATLLYPETYCRPYGDLDLLVADVGRELAREVLLADGFVQGEWDPVSETVAPFSEARLQGYRNELQHEAEFVRYDSATRLRLSIDLHFRLATAFDHFALAPEPMIDAAVRAGDLRVLSPADAFCHAAHHAWWDTQSLDNVLTHTDLRLGHFMDMQRMLTCWELDAGTILRRAEEIGGVQTANWALYCLGQIFGGSQDSGEIDIASAIDVDTSFSDRWLQRGTSSTMFRWSSGSPKRMFAPDRGSVALAAFWSEYVNPRLRRGDVLTWVSRG
jgi:hypothetical protein